MTLKELNTKTKKCGKAAALAYQRTQPGMSFEMACRAPLEDLRASFEGVKLLDELPEHAGFKPFRIGWRGPYTITHGTPAGYSAGCRMECCKVAWRVYSKKRRVARQQELVEGSSKEGWERQRAADVLAATDAWVASMDPEAVRLKAEIMKMKQRLAELGEAE